MDFVVGIFDSLIGQPVVFLLLMALPFFLLARFGNVYPSRRGLLLVCLPACASMMLAISKELWPIVVLIDLFILLIFMIDLFTVVSAKHFHCSRNTQRIASLGKPHQVELAIENRSGRNLSVEIVDDMPDPFVPMPAKFSTRMAPRSRSFHEYRFTPGERGKFMMNCVYLRLQSLLGLWNCFYKRPTENEIDVYPDMKQISQFELLARTNRLSLLGVRRTRKIGTDNEFERLRDYTQDDNYRHIDWRTTARRRKLTVKDFQSNHSQRIVFLVDCGRMMTGMSGKINMLDHALNAMLMLSYVALKQGDSVGLICFSDKIHNYTPARNGVNHINRLLHASFDQHASYVESRYDEAFLHLSKNCRKRSLVVLITNVIDEINANQIHDYLASMSGKHLPLGVLLRDHHLFNAVEDYQDRAPNADLLEAGAAAEILTWRHQVVNDLTRRGVLSMDVFPESLTANLVNQYLEIKARHLL